MQYGQDLEGLIMKIIIANPALGTVYFLNADVSDCFYRIGVYPMRTPKLGIVFTLEGEDKEFVAIALNLPFGWKDFPSICCTATETVVYIENAALRCNTPALMNIMDGVE